MRMTLIFLACAVAILAGCASAPSLEGGIVGTGNKPDCEAAKKKGGGTPLPEECR